MIGTLLFQEKTTEKKRPALFFCSPFLSLSVCLFLNLPVFSLLERRRETVFLVSNKCCPVETTRFASKPCLTILSSFCVFGNYRKLRRTAASQSSTQATELENTRPRLFWMCLPSARRLALSII